MSTVSSLGNGITRSEALGYRAGPTGCDHLEMVEQDEKKKKRG